MNNSLIIWRADLLPQYKKYQREINSAISRVLNSGRYILSNEVETFEKEFAKYMGVKFAVGVASGTDALILSMKAFDIKSGDEVITTPFTAIPTVSAIIIAGATPIFVDIDPETYLIDLEKITKKITKKTKAIMPVHIFGNMVDIKKLRKMIGSKIKIIEDACQAHGSKIGNNFAGTLGDVGAFSFYPTKNVGGYGDGGMVITNNANLANKIRLLRMYGMTNKDHIVINGLNSRLDELQAAILKVKLRHLQEMNNLRHYIAQHYINNLSPKLFQHQQIPSNVYSNYHLFVGRLKGNRKQFVKHLSRLKIQTSIFYPTPLHLQKANEFLGYKVGDLPVTEQVCKEAIGLPMYPELKKKTVEFIIEKINLFS